MKLFLDTKVSALVAESNEIFLYGLTSIVSENSNIEQVCSAKNVTEIDTLLENLVFGLVILDIDMLELDIEKIIAILLQKERSTKILALSSIVDVTQLRKIFKLGVKGYLNKNSPSDEIHIAINSLFKDEFYVDGLLKEQVLKDPLGINSNSQLNNINIELLFLISHELSNKEIAVCLGLSEKTIEYHRKHIFTVLGLRNMAGIGAYAVRNNIYFNVTLTRKFSSWLNGKNKLVTT